ncbi:MAG: DNA-protecting protein DprA [Actinobacteria bacterium]|nr:DNA-protecting protein DprA [Actinomycetota bacterium]
MSACADCLRRTALINFLSPQVSSRLGAPGRARALLAMSDEGLIEAVAGDRAPEARRAVERFGPREARRRLAERGLHAICRHDGRYPSRLTDLEDPPAVLHSSAAPDRLEELVSGPVVAVVGSRRASAYGLEVAREIGRSLSAAGVTVVSGLAMGIDAASHRGALEGGVRTVAVLGCGADRPYPRINAALYRRIRLAGAVVAELPPGAEPKRWTFPARNRIMAGLACATVVVEAAERSGSLITATFAQDLGRDLGAVPGRVTSGEAAGSNALLHAGAAVWRGGADILDAVLGAGNWHRADGSDRAAARRLETRERCVLRAIEQGEPMRGAASAAGLTAAELRAALGRLELMGLVRRDGLGRYERVA